MSLDIPPLASRVLPPTPSPLFFAPPAKLRLGLCVFGVILALCGSWLLLPELLRPRAAGLPQDGAAATAAATHRSAALLAARIGLIRGDLWAEAAFADSSLLWLDRSALLDRANAERLEKARSNTERALALAPVNGAAWLFLAALPGGASSSGDNRVAALLQMSYLTAPNDLDLADLRLERATTSNALADKDIQDLARSDIRRIMAYRPQLKSAIAAAYRNALPQNRPIFEALVGDVDPALAQALRGGASK